MELLKTIDYRLMILESLNSQWNLCKFECFNQSEGFRWLNNFFGSNCDCLWVQASKLVLNSMLSRSHVGFTAIYCNSALIVSCYGRDKFSGSVREMYWHLEPNYDLVASNSNRFSFLLCLKGHVAINLIFCHQKVWKQLSWCHHCYLVLKEI